MNEIQELGPEYVEGFHFFAQWLEMVGTNPGVYRQNSLWYEIAAISSVHVLFKLAELNSMLADYERQPRKFQSFPMRHGFIPKYIQFDLEIVAKQIWGFSTAQYREAARNPSKFWRRHFHTHLRPFRTDSHGRLFDGTFYTDGYGVSILVRHPDVKAYAGQKRQRRGKKRKDRDADLFPTFNTISPVELSKYNDVIFVDPNIRDTLYMMHEASTRQTPRIARYTAMTRR
jgi:hypothetical protein